MKSSTGVSRIVFAVSVVWLTALMSFSLGAYIHAAQIWPYSLIAEIENFVSGDKEEKTGLVARVKNDLDFKPERHIVSQEQVDLFSGKYVSLEGLPLNARRANPKIRFSPGAPDGYRLIFGVFDMEDSFHGVILIDPAGKAVHHWNISQEGVDWNHRPDKNVFPHGVEIARDGSIVVAFDAGTSLTRYDYCSNEVWRLKGNFHHSVAFDNDDAVWTWGDPGRDGSYGNSLTKVDYNSGEVLKSIHITQVIKANPGTDIFSVLQYDDNEGSRWIEDPWHPNDVEPLPARWVDRYPGFEAGDLLVSLRSPNLIFVMDPETLDVKWWRQGLARRPHDPDWNDKGTITIYNNNMHRDFSSIQEIDPASYRHETLVDGEKYDFYAWHRGKHQRLETGGILVTSPPQGWVFEVDENGEVVFEFLNYYGGKMEFLSVSEARFLPTDYFEGLPECE